MTFWKCALEIISKLLEYCKKNIYYGERLNQNCTYIVTETTPRNGEFPRNFPRIWGNLLGSSGLFKTVKSPIFHSFSK